MDGAADGCSCQHRSCRGLIQLGLCPTRVPSCVSRGVGGCLGWSVGVFSVALGALRLLMDSSGRGVVPTHGFYSREVFGVLLHPPEGTGRMKLSTR